MIGLRNLPKVSDSWINNHLSAAGSLYTQDVLDGKWKICIINHLAANKKMRFNELKRILNSYDDINLTDSTLDKKLHELIADQIIAKKVYPEIPPHTEYYLTSKGKDLYKVIGQMKKFGLKYSAQIHHAQLKEKELQKEENKIA